MARHFDVHLLPAPPVAEAGDPYDIPEGGIVFRALPFVALPAGSNVGERFEVLRTWPRYPRARLKILHALDAAKVHNAHVYRLSLGVARSQHPEADALAYAGRFLQAKSRIVVAAAGNWGPAPGTLSDLARTDAVIAVAACDSDGVPLQCSGRGTVDGPIPALTADGTDPLGQATAGTSLATARVAALAVWIRSMLACLVAEANAAFAEAPLVQLPPPSRLAHIDSDFSQHDVDSLVSLRVGRALFPQGGQVYSGASLRRMVWLKQVVDHASTHQVFVSVNPDPITVRALLVAASDGSKCPDPTACGAGVVSRESVRALLAHMLPSRFLRLFVDDGRWDERRAAIAAELDAALGELWSDTDLELLEQHYGAEYEDLFIEIGAPGAAGHGNAMLRVSGEPATMTRQPVFANVDEYGNLTIDDPSSRRSQTADPDV